MGDDRRLQEAIARCVAAMVYHHGAERAGQRDLFLEREAPGLLRDFQRYRPDDVAWERLVSGPVRCELAARYGPEAAATLCQQLLESLRAAKDAGPRRDAGRP